MPQDRRASADRDAAPYSRKSIPIFERVMELYLAGELVELEEPMVGSIALYFNIEDDLIHVGKVIEEETGLIVLSSLEGRQSPFVTYTNEFPLDEIVKVEWTEPISDDVMRLTSSPARRSYDMPIVTSVIGMSSTSGDLDHAEWRWKCLSATGLSGSARMT
jgi:hypothetical protein